MIAAPQLWTTFIVPSIDLKNRSNNSGREPVSKYIRYYLDDESAVLIEVDDNPNVATRGTNPQDKNGIMVQSAETKFETALDNVRRASDTLLKKLVDLHDRPDEIEIEFGLKAIGEMGVFAFAKASTEANYKVTLKWVRKEPRNIPLD